MHTWSIPEKTDNHYLNRYLEVFKTNESEGKNDFRTRFNNIANVLETRQNLSSKIQEIFDRLSKIKDSTTSKFPNIPVFLGENIYDLQTLDQLIKESSNGEAEDPKTGILFTVQNIYGNSQIRDEIEALLLSIERDLELENKGNMLVEEFNDIRHLYRSNLHDDYWERSKEKYNELLPKVIEIAEMGHAEAQWILALENRGNRVDSAKYIYWLQKAVDNKHPVAIYDMATSCYKGYGVEKNIPKAVELFRDVLKSNSQRAIKEAVDYVKFRANSDLKDSLREEIADLEKKSAAQQNASKSQVAALVNLGVTAQPCRQAQPPEIVVPSTRLQTPCIEKEKEKVINKESLFVPPVALTSTQQNKLDIPGLVGIYPIDIPGFPLEFVFDNKLQMENFKGNFSKIMKEKNIENQPLYFVSKKDVTRHILKVGLPLNVIMEIKNGARSESAISYAFQEINRYFDIPHSIIHSSAEESKSCMNLSV